jgi:anti-anti-sigma factor
VEEGNDAASFRLVGELDLSNVPQIQARFREVLRRVGQLTLDASGLTFMDSQGLRMLIELGREAEEAGTTATVLNSSPQVSRLLASAVPRGIPGVRIVEADK